MWQNAGRGWAFYSGGALALPDSHRGCGRQSDHASGILAMDWGQRMPPLRRRPRGHGAPNLGQPGDGAHSSPGVAGAGRAWLRGLIPEDDALERAAMAAGRQSCARSPAALPNRPSLIWTAVRQVALRHGVGGRLARRRAVVRLGPLVQASKPHIVPWLLAGLPRTFRRVPVHGLTELGSVSSDDWERNARADEAARDTAAS